jgi:hypothetical protein
MAAYLSRNDDVTASSASTNDTLQQERDHGYRKRNRRDIGCHAPGQEEVREQGKKNQEFERRGPLDERKIAAGVFQDQRFMDHRQFKVRGRIIYRQAAGFSQGHDEQRSKSQKMAGADRRSRIAQRLRHDAPQVGRTRPQRQAENRHGDGGLGNRSHRHLAARSHSAKSRSRVKPGQREKECSQ